MKLIYHILLLLLLASCQKSFTEEMGGVEDRKVKKLSGLPVGCLSQSSSEMLMILYRPGVNYYFVIKNPDGPDSIRQYIFTNNDIVPGATLQQINSFPAKNLMAISAKKDESQITFGPVSESPVPIKPVFYHDGSDVQAPQFGVSSTGPSSGWYTERNNQIRPGETLIFKLGDLPVSKGLLMYGLRLFLRVPLTSQLVIIDLYHDNELVYSWRPPLVVGPPTPVNSIWDYNLKLSRSQVFNEIHFRIQTAQTSGVQYAVRGARTFNNNRDAEMYAQATAPRFYLTPEFPDLLYLVGSSTQRWAKPARENTLYDPQEFATDGTTLPGRPSYLSFSASGGAFKIDAIGRYGVVTAAEPVGITASKSLTISTATDFYTNSKFDNAVLRLQNTGPIGTQARVEALTEGDVLVGTAQTITFTATGQFKQVTLDPGSTFKKIRFTVPGGAPANSAFVLNPGPPNTSPYQSLTRFYPSCN